jgi:hypothetical protein
MRSPTARKSKANGAARAARPASSLNFPFAMAVGDHFEED